MENKISNVDVLILGGGIAGTGLAFNLRKKGFTGSIALVENRVIGASKAYGYRNTFKEVIDNYDLEYEKRYVGLRDGIEGKEGIQWMDINAPLYFYDYQKACSRLLERSGALLVNDIAEEISVHDSKIRLKKNIFQYKILVDCTGLNGWTRRKIGLPIPQKRYYGLTYVVPSNALKRRPDFYCDDKIIWFFRDDGYTEEIYVMNDCLVIGIWNYSFQNAGQLSIQSGGMLDELGISNNIDLKTGISVVLPAETTMPLVFKNIAYLGDCCGQATPATSEGTRPILLAAELLAAVISKNQPLKIYQKNWIATNLKQYALHKVLKDDIFEFNRFFSRLRRYPKVYKDLILNKFAFIPISVLVPSASYILKSIWKGVKEYKRYKNQIQKAESLEKEYINN